MSEELKKEYKENIEKSLSEIMGNECKISLVETSYETFERATIKINLSMIFSEDQISKLASLCGVFIEAGSTVSVTSTIKITGFH